MQIENATAGDSSSAAVRIDTPTGDFTLKNSRIYNAYDHGILLGSAASFPAYNATIQNTIFDTVVTGGNDQEHGIYCGPYNNLTMTGNYFTTLTGGFAIKSRAVSTTLLYNEVRDGTTSNQSAAVDIACGGRSMRLEMFLRKVR